VSVPVALGVGLVGGLGAVARFLLDGAVAARIGREFPYGTLIVNVSGAFALGLVVGLAVGQNVYRLAGTGLLGAFTTFSTWVFESHRLGEEGELGLGLLNFAVSLVMGIAAAWAGRHVGSWL
jgi:fluoride exporter